MKRYMLLVFSLALLLVPLDLRAQEEQAKWKFITTDELKKIYDAKEDFLLINALSPIEYAEERIKGSVNIPFTALKSGKTKLPANKNKKLVFYCKGPK